MNDTKELHYRYNLIYGAIILLATIVVLLTVKWGCIQGLVDYISFGLTLTSLFLALIAIIYAIISNTTFSQHLGTLRSASQGVSEVAVGLNRVTTMLDSKIQELPTLIRNVESKLDETRKEIREHTFKQDTSAAIPKGNPPTPEGFDIKEFLSAFLKSTSFNGLLALYTAQLANSSKKPFDITKVWEGSPMNTNYGYGYLIACSSVGFINHTTKDDMWSISYMSEDIPPLRPMLLNWLREYVKDKPKITLESEEKASIIPIENYFKD
jgi:ABC-type multidrug transport system fused ATPase/permease subunit